MIWQATCLDCAINPLIIQSFLIAMTFKREKLHSKINPCYKMISTGNRICNNWPNRIKLKQNFQHCQITIFLKINLSAGITPPWIWNCLNCRILTKRNWLKLIIGLSGIRPWIHQIIHKEAHFRSRKYENKVHCQRFNTSRLTESTKHN